MILNDIEGSDHLIHEYGERFEGWYFTKIFLKKEDLPLTYKKTKLTYSFNVYDYNFRFIMPSRIEFVEGLISYSNGERELGIFRFPRDSDERFIAPISLDCNKMNDYMNLSKENVNKLLSLKEPLMFEAFKIPQYGFKLFDLTADIIEDISKDTDKEFVVYVKGLFNRIVKEKTAEIAERIKSGINYLLILRNVLNRQWKNFDEVSLATDEIIHI